LEPFSVNEVVSWSTNASCGHVFHHQCIKEWLLRRTGCPYCRLPLLNVDCKSSETFTDEDLTKIVAEWRRRATRTYYCIKNGLVELDGKLTPQQKELISPGVKREELAKMRETRASSTKNRFCC
jgi:hypothetical protein